MNKVNFVEIAEYCQEQARIKHSSSRNSYSSSLFASISVDNKIECSYTPHILAAAKQCLLIHAYVFTPGCKAYTFYDIEYIDENGCVNQSRLDGNFRLYITFRDHWDNQIMYLRSNDEKTTYYSCTGPWQDKIEVVWNLYLKIRNCSLQEAKMVASLAMKDKQIALQAKCINELEVTKLYLEQEVAAYRGMLDEIKLLVKGNESIKQ